MPVLGFDNFNRPNSSPSWGVASNGVPWTVVRGNNSSYAIAANTGTISGTSAETAQFVGAGNKTSANFRIMASVSKATNGGSSTACLARASVDGSHNITAYKLRLKSGNLDLVSEVVGVNTVIATTPYAVTLGQFDSLDLMVIGNQLWANAWPDGTDEPTGWMIGPITNNAVTGIGQAGLSATPQPGDTASFDTFSYDTLAPLGSPLPDTPFGYTLLNKNPIPQDTLQDIVAQHYTWIRPQSNWSAMEKTDDGSRGSTLSSLIDWSLMDDIVARGNSLGLNICMTVQNPPTWHCFEVLSPANSDPIEIPNVLDIVAFMTALITRYNGVTINLITGSPYGTIQALMLNEDADPYAAGWPTNGNPTYIGRDSTPFAPIFATMYPIIKTQLPSCKVGCASLLGKRTDAAHIHTWVTNLFTAWGAGHCYVDFMDLHFYNCASPPTLPNNNLHDPPLADRLNAIKSACIAAGFPNLDIWMTEVGYQQGTIPPASCDVTQAQQTAYIQQTQQMAFDLGVSHVFLWTIGSKDNNSIVQGHSSKKVYLPAYYGQQIFAGQNPVLRANLPTVETTVRHTSGIVQPIHTSGITQTRSQ